MPRENIEGDHRKFEQLVLLHRDFLLRYATSFTGATFEAEDLVQETLLKAFRAFHRLRPGSEVRAWLGSILRNTFISTWRRRRRERALLQHEQDPARAPWLAPKALADPPGEGANEGLGDEVTRALDEVPPAYRTLLVLVDIEDKTYREAAEMTDQPLGTVQSRLFRGRRLLRTKLADYALDEGYLPQAA